MMKIGMLVWDLNVSGGTQRQVLELALYLQEDAKQNVVMYTYLYDPETCYPKLCAKLDIRHVNRRGLEKYKGKSKEFLRLVVKYFRFYFEIDQKKLLNILDDDIDILNVHDYHVYPTAGLWKIKTGKPVVWMMNDMPMYQWNPKKVLKTALFHLKPTFRGYVKAFDKIVVLDHLNLEQVQRNFGRSAKIVRSGLDIEKFSFHPREHPSEIIQLLSVGIFFPHRRIEDTIKAISILLRRGYPVTLHYVGSDARGMGYARKIYSMVKDLGLSDKIVFHKRVSDQELLQLFQNADIFVFPNAPQTWGLSVFEAMACGLPAIVTIGCGASEVLHDRVNAMIVEPRNPTGIADAIECLHNDHDLWNCISREGREFVERNISWKLYAESMLRIFKSCYRKLD